MRLGRASAERSYQTSYLESTFLINSIPKIKINGILFTRDEATMEEENVTEICKSVDKQLRSWSRRNLTTLGKILIVKTFGIARIIFLMQSLAISPGSFKKLKSILYKFIWNRHFLAAKAPERITREIVNLPIKAGGLGMLDIAALDDSLKLRALGRLLETKHPFLKLIKNKINAASDFSRSQIS